MFRLFPNGTVSHSQAIGENEGGLPAGTLEDSDRLGRAVSTECGDIDSDGFNDVLVPAMLSDAGGISGSDLGALYVLFMQADDTVRTFTRISQAAGEGLDNLPVSLTQIGWGIGAIPPRSSGNPVDVLLGTVV